MKEFVELVRMVYAIYSNSFWLAEVIQPIRTSRRNVNPHGAESSTPMARNRQPPWRQNVNPGALFFDFQFLIFKFLATGDELEQVAYTIRISSENSFI